MLTSVLLTAQALNVDLQHAFTLSTYTAYDVVIDPKTYNFAFTDSKNVTYHVEYMKKKVTRLCEGQIAEQIDCGARLLSVLTRGDNPKTLTFSMATGKLVGSVPGRMHRVGKLIQGKSEILDLQGKVVHRYATQYGKPTPDYIGRLIWDGKRRLAIVGRDDQPNDTKDVVEILPGWKKGKRAWLSDFAMSFDGLVGNPDVGPFAIFEASNRTRRTTGLFTKDLKRLGGEMIAITDISKQGILGNKLKADMTGSNLLIDKGFCLTPSGKQRWEGPAVGKWFGSGVLTGRTYLRNGKPVGKVVTPPGASSIIGHQESLFLCNMKNGGIGVYRYKG